MKKIVILSGAGMSAESGIKTFRDAGGLWEGHDVMEVASPEGWHKNKALVLDFYNRRRKQLFEVQPNHGHIIAAELEKDFDVHIITQNVDDLHERAGSSNVLHLHGELLKARSIHNEFDIIDWQADINIGDLHTDGHQLRPHIVWFGEAVPTIPQAIDIVEEADYLIVIGTSLQVYPAAGLIDYAKPTIPLFYIDPNPATIPYLKNSVEVVPLTASEGMAVVREKLEKYNLTDLITNKGFDRFKDGLGARFEAEGMDYDYIYETANHSPTLTINLKKGLRNTIIRINENGELQFTYIQIYHRFKNCTQEDFHTMLAHAFIFLRDGNFDYHKEWYENLEKA